MKYLEDALNIKVTYHDWDGQDSLPYLLTDRYKFEVASLDNATAIFAYPKGNIDPVSTIKKHFALIAKASDMPVVLILEKCTARQRKALIENHLSFIVDGYQIYLPFMGAILRESFAKESEATALLPSAQLLLFFYIYSGLHEMPMKHIAEKLGLTAMSVSRAVRQLEGMKLLRAYKDGVKKIITSDLYGKELYEKAGPMLRTPVKKKGYIERKAIDGCKAGITALSEFTNLNPPKVETFAMKELPDGAQLDELVDENGQLSVELWTYNPLVLAQNGCVDILSLHQSLKNDPDERVQSELDKMLDKFWGDYHHDQRIRKL